MRFGLRSRRRLAGWVEIHEEACTGCAECVPVCPLEGLTLAPPGEVGGRPAARFLLDRCRGDAFCLRACPQPGAITVHHEP